MSIKPLFRCISPSILLVHLFSTYRSNTLIIADELEEYASFDSVPVTGTCLLQSRGSVVRVFGDDRDSGPSTRVTVVLSRQASIARNEDFADVQLEPTNAPRGAAGKGARAGSAE